VAALVRSAFYSPNPINGDCADDETGVLVL
jgi:hypothetical protein